MFPEWETGKHWGNMRAIWSFLEKCFLVLLTFIETDRLEFTPRDSSRRKVYEVFAARMRKLITSRARKTKRTARMLANARKDHSIPLIIGCSMCVLRWEIPKLSAFHCLILCFTVKTTSHQWSMSHKNSSLVEHCSIGAEAMGSNPVEALKFFSG